MIKSSDKIRDLPKEFNSLEGRYAKVRTRLAEHERWIKQLAEKLGVILGE